MRFAAPTAFHLLYLIPILIVFYVVAFRRKKRAIAIFGDPELMRTLTESVSSKKQIWKVALNVLGVLFLILALARPQFGMKLEQIKRSGLDIMVVLDTSLSMLAEDVKPSRLERAKYEMGRLIERLSGDRIGVVAFAGESFVQCPLTMDYGAAKMLLDVLHTGTIPVPGSVIGGAIGKAAKAFNIKDRKYKAIVLLTDGENLEGDPVEAAQAAAKEGVRIYAVGLGTHSGEVIRIKDEKGRFTGYKKDRGGSIVKTRLDEKTLEEMAGVTRGKYYRASTSSSVADQIYEDLSKLEKRELESKEYAQYQERFQYFLFVAILLFGLEALLSDRKRKRRGSGGGLLSFILCPLSFILFLGLGDPIATKNEKGNEFFRHEQYDDALTYYRDAQLDAPDLPALHFNVGDALYKQGKFDEALQAYEQALDAEDGDFQGKVYYNMGNAFFRQSQLSESLEAYKKSLVLVPKDAEAKFNLEFVQSKLQEQEQKQQQQGQDEEQDGEKKEQDQDRQEKGEEQDQEQQEREQGASEQQEEQQDQSAQEQEKQPAEEAMSEEDAQRILNALNEKEKEIQEKRRVKMARRRVRGMDW
jgi:Ca-activated chloride channel family protein